MRKSNISNTDDDGVVRKHVRGADEDEGAVEDMFGRDEADETEPQHTKYVDRSRLHLK